jgi:NADPH:quinone reductase-like Zn-dependent oxidoreductase
MNAIVYTRYGPPDVLQLKEVKKPTARDSEVLVAVQAASVNHGDWSFVRGKPFLVRLIGAGLLRPKNPILGSDIAGRIEAVGRDVRRFRPGDEVFGETADCGWGGYAEYVAVPESALALKPANLSFEEAAAVPQAATVALQGLRDQGEIQPGRKVLINGAGGGIGSFAVQIAKSFGAEVTAVDGPRKLDMLRSIGADHVIDYTQQDFTTSGPQYDLILDIVANRSISDVVRALGPAGNYVAVAFSPTTLLRRPRIPKGGSQKVSSLAAQASVEDLVFLRELLEARKVVPVIDRCYPLSETAEAVRHYGEGHPLGKVVVVVDHDNGS